MAGLLKGIAASDGIAFAKAYRLLEPDLTVEKRTVSDTAAEVNRFRTALKKSETELEVIKEKARRFHYL